MIRIVHPRSWILTFYPSRIPDPGTGSATLPQTTGTHLFTYLSTCLPVCLSELIKLSLLIEGGSRHPICVLVGSYLTPYTVCRIPFHLSNSLVIHLSHSVKAQGPLPFPVSTCPPVYLPQILPILPAPLRSSPISTFYLSHPVKRDASAPTFAKILPFITSRAFSCLSKCIPTTCLCFSHISACLCPTLVSSCLTLSLCLPVSPTYLSLFVEREASTRLCGDPA